MTRNQLMKSVDDLARVLEPKAQTPADWALVGELERFQNDLCHAPTKHNFEMRGVNVYTMRMARKKFSELRRLERAKAAAIGMAGK